jgi:aquaporin NIP
MASLAHSHPRWSTTRPQLLRKVGAEAVGTFTLVFAGCGAVAADAASGGAVGAVGVALTFGLAVMVMIYATGHVSGAHFNPAVTIAFAAVGRFPWRQVPAYIGGQVAAAILAAGLLRVLVADALPLGTTRVADGLDLSAAFALEAVLTFFLMFVIVSVATDSRAIGQLAGAAIGGTVTLGALFGGPFTGASMNPARSLGPALVSGELDSIWLYGTAPVVGALLATIAYQLLRCDDEPPADAGGCC